MTREEMEIETLKYRAPTVVPLDNGQLAVLTPGQPGIGYHICRTFDGLKMVIEQYCEWNQREAVKPPRKTSEASKLALSVLSYLDEDELIKAALSAINKEPLK
jgi:hypothetical protein